MIAALGTLRKIAGMSPTELGVRSRQALQKSCERYLGVSQGELDDRSLRRQLIPSLQTASIETVAGTVLKSFACMDGGPGFMPGLRSREAVVQLMNSRFQEERAALLDRAGRAIEGRFDLLGLHDVSFGLPIDWLLEPTSGKRIGLDHWSRIPYLAPELAGDKKITWELNRHGHFVTLGQAYWLTNDERYAEAFVTQLSGWLDANPPRLGINWASSLEAAFRSIAWLWSLHFFAASSRLTPGFIWRVLKSIVQHGRYIESYLSYYFAPNTHLTGEALGLFYLGAALPFLQPAKRWRSLGCEILLDQLGKQVRADGVYFEQSSYYHRYTTDFYLHLLLHSQATGTMLPPIVEQKLSGLLDHLLWITRPDGLSTMYGDDDGGRLLSLGERASADFRDTLQLGATLLGRRDWKWMAGPATVELLWLLGPEGLEAYDLLEAESPDSRVHYFGSSGNAVLRDGWHPDAAYVFFDGGVHGAVNYVHAHADALSIEFSADRVAWIVDPGTYTYTKDPALRDYFRSTAAHNTVVINGLSQAVPAGPFSWSHVPETTFRRLHMTDGEVVAEGEHNGYERLVPPVRHSRGCHLLKRTDGSSATSYVMLRDTIWTGGVTHAALRFHLSPDCRATHDGTCVRVSHVSGKQLTIATWQLAADGTLSPLPIKREMGWVSPCYGQREPAEILTAEIEAKASLTLITVLVPSRPGEDLDLEALSKQESPCIGASR